jgi:hypothetical protein
MQNGIGSGVQVGRALRDPAENVKEFFPESGHGKHLVRPVAVQEKCLPEKGKVPVGYEEQKYNH